ncbi:MAG: phosphoribosylaminoimidazolesuccinocarboxamide synthase [Kiritimatiellae bacterium]|nr:phosphoribosylaminoimidazolesuccinocarboxamide synthase [Kiritimatiellia bacterium]
MKLLYEGKAKRLFETERPDELLMEFKDDATAFNGEKKEQLENKGRVNKKLSLLLYNLLEKEGIKTHFIRDVDEINMIVKRVEIILVEVVTRNVVAGSLAKRTGLKEGHVLTEPIVETYYKDDSLGDPLINSDHIRVLKLASEDEVNELKRQSLTINKDLTAFFTSIGIQLVDFKLEFGRVYPDFKEVILADEISPDTCRFWDIETGEKMDKDRFRRDLGDVIESYEQVLTRVEDAVLH